MIILNGTTESITFQTSAAGSVDYVASFVDLTATTFVPGVQNGNITTAATTTIVSAPAASTQRQIKHMALTNVGTVRQTINIFKVDGLGSRSLYSRNVNLEPNECIQYSPEGGFTIVGVDGALKSSRIAQQTTMKNITFFKVGTAPEAAGSLYMFAKDPGFPGAWVPGTPGLAGRATDGLTSADNGCLRLWDAAGELFLQDFACWGGLGYGRIIDVLWVNSGLVVTTTTAQTVNSVAFPPRDRDFSTNGVGVQIGLYWSVASNNASVISNATISYTNQDGVAGRTATVNATYPIPITPVVGTLVPFQLAAGDSGVRSIQSVTLGTTLGVGTIHAIAFVPIIGSPMAANSTVAPPTRTPYPGIKVGKNSCLMPVVGASSTAAFTMSGDLRVVEK